MRPTLLLAALLLPLPTLAQTPAATLEDGAGADLLVVPADGGLLVPGRFGAAIPVEGGGSRLMWHAGKSAFRAGGAFGTSWDDANVGSFSAAFGDRTTASGFAAAAFGREAAAGGYAALAAGFGTTASADYTTALGSETSATNTFATALGRQTAASGLNALATGYQTTASGSRATAMGSQTTAAGTASTALGHGTVATGSYSTAMGLGTTAPHAAGLVVGQYNDPAACNDPIIPRQVLLSAGYGTSDGARRNVLTVCATNAFSSSDAVLARAGLFVSEFSIFEGGVRVESFLFVDGELNTADDVGVDGTVTADAFVESSDRRLKTDIVPMGRVLDRLLGLAPVTYRLREGDGAREVGLIAQDVRAAFPELVAEDGEGMLAVSYSRLTAVLIAGLQEQQAEIDRAEARVAALEARLDALDAGGRPPRTAGLALALGLALVGGVGYGLRRARPAA